jgi:hypothetical protein
MKRILSTLLLISLFSFGYSQYYISCTGSGNPNSLNSLDEYPLGGGLDPSWTSILGGNQTTPAWSPNQTIPFPFSFNGAAVTQYKVSSSGVLTFSTSATAVPPAANTSLPSASIPDNSVMVWGLAGVGGNDNIVVQTFGTAPNRQHWVFFSSYNYNGGASACWHYFSIVLEESSNSIYIVDQRRTPTASCVPSLTLGVQVNSTTASEIPGSPNYSGMAGTDFSDADNVYYEFVQGTQPAYDASMNSVDMQQFIPIATAPITVEGTFTNKGSQTITSFDVNYTINGGTPVTSSVTGVSIAPCDAYSFSSSMGWTPAMEGQYTIEVYLTNFNNGNMDGNPSNDRASATVDVIGAFVPRTVLHEDFTSSSCPPCLPGGIQLRSVLDARPDSTHTLISYPCRFPSTGDPYHTTEVFNRRGYYGVNSIPRLLLDGGWDDNPNGYTTADFDAFAQLPSFLDLSATYSVDGQSVDVSVSMDPLRDNNSNDLRLFIAIFEVLTENNRSIDNPNGETEWHNYMKKMLPDENGIALQPFTAGNALTIPIPAYTFQGNYRLPRDGTTNNIINHAIEHSVEEFCDLGVVVWVQDVNTQEVLQSAYAEYDCQPLVVATDATPDNGTSNGTAVVTTVAGGCGTYDYSWSTTPAQTGPIATGLANGTYTLTITDAYGCEQTEEVTVDSNVGIDDLQSAGINSLKAFPNPSKGIFNLQIELAKFDDLQVQIFDMAGKQVFADQQQNTSQYQQQIDLSQAAAGVYMLRVRTSQGMSSQRIVIE